MEYDNNVVGSFFKTRSQPVYDMMDFLCIKLEVQFAMTVFERWKELVKFNSHRQLISLVGRMSKHVLSRRNSPQKDKILSLISEYFLGKFKHDIRSCITLELIGNDDESLDKVLEIIQENKENFTTAALSATRNQRYSRFLRYTAEKIMYC